MSHSVKNYFKIVIKKLSFHVLANRIETDCSGTLINNRYVITAANCVSRTKPIYGKITVRLGEWDTTTNPDCDDSYIDGSICNDPHVDIDVEDIIVHKDFNPLTTRNDIALLRLSKNVEYTRFIQPICLPVDNSVRYQNLTGMALDVTGWGLFF